MIRVKFIQTEDNREIAYFPNTRRFFFVNEKAKGFIEDLVNGKEKEAVMQAYEIDSETYDQYYAQMTEQFKWEQPETANGNSPEKTQKASSEEKNKEEKKECEECKKGDGSCKKKRLGRLVIHLSNDCNLRCVYCYANGGVYKSKHDLLKKEMADKIVDVFFKEYDEILGIQFFGGEPLLNMDMLEYICEKVRAINEEKGYQTHFGIVINGTLINDRFIELVKKYDIGVTVSYDGHPEVSDRTRPFPNGKGSSETILSNIDKLKAATGQPTTIEATYTQYHLDAGVTPLDVADHIRERLNIPVHLVPAGGKEECGFVLKDLGVFPASVAEVCNRLLANPSKEATHYSLADRLFSALEQKYETSPYICDAGVGTISVSTKGEIYPCFMFTDYEDQMLGNVEDEGVFESERFHSILNRIQEFSYKPNNKECKKCFANTICCGCLGSNTMATGDIFTMDVKDCDMTRAMAEEAIKGLAKLYEYNKEVIRKAEQEAEQNKAKENDEAV